MRHALTPKARQIIVFSGLRHVERPFLPRPSLESARTRKLTVGAAKKHAGQNSGLLYARGREPTESDSRSVSASSDPTTTYIDCFTHLFLDRLLKYFGRDSATPQLTLITHNNRQSDTLTHMYLSHTPT